MELYPALYLEKRGRDILGPTAAFAILADAFSAILQDRFFTEDFTPEVYTAFGLARAKSTTLVDLLNRHCNAGLARTEFITKLPGATHRCGAWAIGCVWVCVCGGGGMGGAPGPSVCVFVCVGGGGGDACRMRHWQRATAGTGVVAWSCVFKGPGGTVHGTPSANPTPAAWIG